MEWINDLINDVILNMGIWGPILACFLLMLEALFPILPLVVFVSVNFLIFGNIFGLIISLFFTIIGCLLVYLLFKQKLKKSFDHKLKDKKYIKSIMDGFDHMSFSTLVVLIANPFLPGFIFNIGAGLSKISFRKFFAALIIGKTFLVYFSGFVGTSLVESLVEPWVLIRTILILLIAYLVSYIVNKKLKID